MKTVYSIKDGSPVYVLPSRRDEGVYPVPKGTTIFPPPTYDPNLYRIEFKNNHWHLINIRTNESTEVNQSFSPMAMLRKERNKRLDDFDKAKEKFEVMGQELPLTWIDYRRDLLNLPQQIEAGLADKPKVVGNQLIYDDWPIAPF